MVSSWKCWNLPKAAKSRTWNSFVHQYSRPAAEVLVFCDADIELPEVDSLVRLINGLQANPALSVMNSQPIKDIIYRPAKLGLVDKLIALSAGKLDDWKTAICGQLYAMPSPAARSAYLPIGLPVEDGFLRAMVLTDGLIGPENLGRIDGEEGVFHIYAFRADGVFPDPASDPDCYRLGHQYGLFCLAARPSCRATSCRACGRVNR